MELLLQYITFAINFNASDIVTLKISQLLVDYAGNESSVFIAAGSFEKQLMENIPRTYHLWGKEQNDFCLAPAVILDVRMQNITSYHLRPKNWRFYTKVAIICDKSQKIQVQEQAYTLGICKLLVLMVMDNDVETSTITEACKGVERLPMPSDNCKANVSILDLPPYVILKNNHLAGFEGNVMQAAADHLRSKLSVINQGEAGYGQFSPPSGVLGDMATGTSMAAFGTIYPWHWRWLGAEMIFGCQTTSIAWSAPVGAGPSQPTWFTILVSELSATVWAFTLAVYIALIPISILFDNRAGHHMYRPFYILALIIGSAQTLIFHKKFTALILFFGFMISAYYQAMMSTKLTVPKKVPEITNLIELANSKLKLTGPISHGKIMEAAAAAFPGDGEKMKIWQRFHASEIAASEQLLTMSKTRDIAYLRHGFTLLYLARKNVLTAGRVHIVEEAVVKYSPVVLTPKNSCLAPKLQEIYLRLCASGLSAKWMTDYTTGHKSKNRKIPHRLNLDQITGFLYLILFGWAMATIAFLCEKLFYISWKNRTLNLFKRQEGINN